MFDKPAPAGGSGDVIDQQQHLGDLLVITVHEHIPSMTTKFTKPGETTEAARCDVYAIAPDATVSAEYHDTLVFGRVLVGQLRRSVGRTVVGILGLGEQRGSNSAPYLLNEAPAAAEEAAIRAMSTKPAPAAQPAQQAPAQQQAPAPATNGWGAPPAQQQAPAAPWAQPAAAGATPAPPWGQ